MSDPEQRQVVVGAAILDAAPSPSARVLATQRAAPPALAGLWEFPGGKVEPGETEIGALVRECREELGLEIEVTERLGSDVLTADGEMLLRVYLARVVDGDLDLTEHADARWLGAADLTSVPWIPADQPVVDALRLVLRS